MIKNIIFDLGNVLVKFRWQEFLHEKGFDGEIYDRLVLAAIKSETWKEFDRGIWSDAEVIDSFVRNDPEIEKEIHEAFDNTSGICEMYDYAPKWISTLQSKGYKVYFLSNYSEKVRTECPDATAFTSMMDGGIWSDLVRMIKPGEDIFQKILDTYNLNAEECLFLDDTLPNIETAKRLGFNTIHFTDRDVANEEIRKYLSFSL